VDLVPLDRPPDAFQQPVTADQLRLICLRASGVEPGSATELGGGMYNTTYRVEFATRPPAILRVAPEPARQSRIERELMRNELAVQPYLAPIAFLLPRILAVDFSHELIGRDWMLQSVVPGIPAAEGLGARPRTEWGPLFARLGEIARLVHDVSGPHFGPIAGPWFSRWSDALSSSFEDTAADLEDAGLEAKDVRDVAALTETYRDVLDEVDEPRLMSGDLWTVNCMVAEGEGPLTLTGVLDFDRASWGAPDADWTIYMAERRTSPERASFWETYGSLETDPVARLIYRARHLGAIRLERHRIGRHDLLDETYTELAGILSGLR
jgi:aminoglycoside phosphotransferase (APT) family kinase protein